MKNTSKRTANGRPYVATLLALALVLSLLTSIPITASAANADALKTKIENFDGGTMHRGHSQQRCPATL